jgi:acetoin utilization deacetylase AcuC-like enzyme
MLTIYSSDHRLHQGVELKDGAVSESFEKPARAETVLARVKATGLGDVIAPAAYDRSAYTAVHSERYVDFQANAWTQWAATGRACQALPLVWPVSGLPSNELPQFIDGQLGFFSMDAGSPINAGTWDAVRSSANTALTGIDRLANGERAVFALCRPPGHHAGREYMGGYCYLNNAAIAAQRCIDRGATRMVVLDVDFHHGNGTQEIFYKRSDVLYVSLHCDPAVCFPYFAGHADERGVGEGLGFNLNLPLPKGTVMSEYEAALQRAAAAIVLHAPDALVVSLGVDTFEHDPISHFRLRTEDYLRIGAIIEQLGVPTLFVMEGGYLVDEIGINVVNVLMGFEGRA